MIGYFITLLAFGIAYVFTKSGFASFFVALVPLVMTMQFREQQKEEAKLQALSPEDRKSFEEATQKRRERIAAEGVHKHETKLKYSNAAQIINSFYPSLCKPYFSRQGNGVWCNDKRLANKIARIIKLEFKGGKYHIINEEDTCRKAEIICHNHIRKYYS
jgi:uncharacterized membrane protein